MSDNSERDPVEVLAEEFVERHRRGERPSVTEYVTRQPDRADAIRELFPALIVMEDLKPGGEPVSSSDARDKVGREQPPQQLGDYRILREVGRGGMGVVYEAEQVSLGRHVALKVLPTHSLMTPTNLERFRREAKAAAKLHHTNIVPVFGVGAADGVHFYAMQFIRGEAMDKVLHDVRRLRQHHGGAADAETATVSRFGKSAAQGLITGSFPGASPGPVQPAAATVNARPEPESGGSVTGLSSAGRTDAAYFRSVARLGLQAAEALAYAHKQGVLHRDIKPSNLLLDLEGTVWITDFGLAKAEGTDELTHAGDIVGTIRYMAPERFDGQSLPQSDIYSLGITLYEMLTLRPAFDASDRNRLIQGVTHDEPARPRSLNRAVPRDLETIVLKAIAKEPAHRYPSAAELAADLRRFADDRPIRARRVGELEKAWRWCRRNPLAAAVAGLAAVLVTLLAVGLPLGLMLRSERNRAVGYLERAEKNLDRAERAEREIRLRSHLAQARAFRHSGQPGQRFSCLEELAKAAALNPSPELMGELRDETIAALALVDLRPARTWDVSSPAGFLTFDASFDRYAWWDNNGAIHLVQTADQRVERKLAAPGTHFGSVYFSPDGRYLCAAYTLLGKRVSWLWPLADCRPPVLLTGEVKAFSPDGRLVLTWVSLADGEMRVSETTTAREVARFKVGPGWHAFAFHPESRLLAVSQDGPLQIWDATTGSMVRTVPGITGQHVVAWHPRGRHLAAGGAVNRESVIRVWDTAADRLQAEMRVPTERIGAVQFNNAGDLLLSTGWDETYRLWDPMTGRQHLAVGGGGGIQMSFSSDDRTIAYTRTGTKVTLWEVARAGVERYVVGPRLFGGVHSAQFSRDGRLLCLGGRGLVLWDRRQSREVKFVPEADHGVFHPTGDSLLTAGRFGLCRWPIAPSSSNAVAAPTTVRVGPPDWLTELRPHGSVSLAGNGRTAATIDQERFQALIVNLENPERVVTTARHEGMATVALSPDGRWLATGVYRSGGAGRTKVWDTNKFGAWVCDLPHDLAAGDAVVLFSPDGRWLVSANPQVYRFWQVGSWEPGPSIEREQGGSIAGSMAFSPDGRVLAIARTGTQVQLVDARDASKLADLEVADPYLIRSLAFSPDGATLVVGRDNQTIHVWDLRVLRARLCHLGLDWELPALPQAVATEPVRFEVHSDMPRLRQDPVQARNRVKSYTAKLARNPDDVEAYHHRAHAYEVLADHRRAVADFTEAIRRKPGDAHFHACRGKGYLALKDNAGAINDWTRSLELKPDQPEVCNDLSWLLSTGPESVRDVKRALALAQRAVKLRHEDGRFLNTLGVARYRAGDTREAVAALEKGLAVSPGRHDAFNLYFLTMCHARLGEPARAKDCLERAVRWHEARGKSLGASERQELLEFRAEATRVCQTVR